MAADLILKMKLDDKLSPELKKTLKTLNALGIKSGEFSKQLRKLQDNKKGFLSGSTKSDIASLDTLKNKITQMKKQLIGLKGAEATALRGNIKTEQANLESAYRREITKNIRANDKLKEAMSRRLSVAGKLYNQQNKLISQNKAETAAKRKLASATNSVTAATHRNTIANKNSINNIVRHIRQIETFVFGLYAVKKAYDATLGVGFEFNRLMENEATGYKMLITQNIADIDAMGKRLTLQKKINIATKEAQKAIEIVRAINPETPQNFAETAQVYKLVIPQLLKYGATLEQIGTITKKTAILSKGMGIEFQQLLKTVDSAFTGQAKESGLRRALAQYDITNAGIKKAREAGKLVDYLLDRMANIDPKLLGITSTFDNAVARFTNSWQGLWGEIEEKQFEKFKVALNSIAKSITDNQPALVEMAGNVKYLSEAIISLGGALATIKFGRYINGLSTASSLTRNFGRRFAVVSQGAGVMRGALYGLTMTLHDLGRSFRSFLSMNAPFLIFATAFELWQRYADRNAEAQKRMNDALDTTIDKLRTMTKSQRDYMIMLSEQKIIEERQNVTSAYRNLRDVKRSNPTFEERTAAQAQYDTAVATLRVHTDKLRILKAENEKVDSLSKSEQARLRHAENGNKALYKTADAAVVADKKIGNAAKTAAQLAKNLFDSANALAGLKIDLALQSGNLNPLQAQYEKINLTSPQQNSAVLLKSVDNVAVLKRELALKQFYTEVQTKEIYKQKESLQIAYKRKMIGADSVTQKKLEVAQATKELEILQKKSTIDKSTDYSSQIAQAQLSIEEKKVSLREAQDREQKKLLTKQTRDNKHAANEISKAWKEAAKDAADEWKNTFSIFESGINGILHGNIFDSIGGTLSKLGDQMLKPIIDKWASGLTTAWTGIVKPQGGFGAAMAKDVGDSITNGIQQGLTPKLASKIATKDFKSTLTKGLQPDVVAWFNSFKQYAAQHGESIRIAPQGGFRTAAQQRKIYDRNTPEQWLTSKDGDIKKSVHQYGRAMDIISTAGYKAVKANTHIAKLMRSFGKVNSASERFLSMAKDPNHVEINRNGVKTYAKNGETLAKSFSKHMPSAGKQLAAPLLKGGEGQSGNLLGGLGMNLVGMLVSGLPSILGSLFGHKVTEAERKAATGQTDFSGDNFASVMEAFNNSQYKLLEYTQKQNMYLASLDNNFLKVALALTPDSAGLTSMAPSGANFVSKQSNVLFGLFSSTTQLISSGMNLLVNDFASGFEKIQTYYTEQKDSSFLFGIFSSSKISTKFTDVDPKTAKLFNKSLQGGYDSILSAAVSLGFDKDKTIKALNRAKLTIGKDGKIDMKRLSPEEQSKRLKAAFSEMFGGAVSQIGDLDTITKQYTEGMENQYETLLKIATINDQVTEGLRSIGISLTDVIAPAKKASGLFYGFVSSFDKAIEKYTATQQRLDMITGAAFGADMNTGAKNFQQGINDYYANFMTKEEQYKSSFSQIQGYLHGIGVEAKQFDDPKKMKEWWKNLINGWDHSTKASNEAFGQLLTLSGQYSQLISLEEQLNKTRADGTKSLLDLYTGQYSPLRMAEKTAFANNVYRNDTTDPLNTSKRALELAYKSARTDEDYQKEFLQYQKELIKQGADTSLKDLKDELLASRKVQTEMRDEMHELRLSNERMVELQKDSA